MVIHHNPQSLLPTDYFGILKVECNEWWATFSTTKSRLDTNKIFLISSDLDAISKWLNLILYYSYALWINICFVSFETVSIRL